MSPPVFEAVWPLVKDINGWLTQNEAKHLYEHALKVSPDHIILEVGAFHGRSAALMSHTGRKVVTVDPMVTHEDLSNHIAITELDAITLRKNSEKFGFQWLRCNSEGCPLIFSGEIGLIYIDANHQYPHPLQDFRHFWPCLASNAIVAFHDYGQTFPGVTQSVKELQEAGLITKSRPVGSMLICSAFTI